MTLTIPSEEETVSNPCYRGLLRAAEELAPEWVEVRFFDIGQLPFFNEDVEAASNAVLIATPEYNGAVPGVLANAIDWASRPSGRSVLRNKPVAVMGAVLGQSGSANAQTTLRGVPGRIGAIVVPDPQVLVPRASRLFDEQVDLRDEGTSEKIRHLVDAVAHWCRRVSSPKSPPVHSRQLARSSGSKDGNITSCRRLLHHHFEHKALLV